MSVFCFLNHSKNEYRCVTPSCVAPFPTIFKNTSFGRPRPIYTLRLWTEKPNNFKCMSLFQLEFFLLAESICWNWIVVYPFIGKTAVSGCHSFNYAKNAYIHYLQPTKKLLSYPWWCILDHKTIFKNSLIAFIKVGCVS